jgi:5-methylcytosine-specific restriction endonuclease McrA
MVGKPGDQNPQAFGGRIMRLTFCVACGATADLQHHHLVSKLDGGSDDEHNLFTLCHGCTTLHQRTPADAFAANVRPIIDSLGEMSLRAKARELNARGVPTPGGGQWLASTVQRVLARR